MTLSWQSNSLHNPEFASSHLRILHPWPRRPTPIPTAISTPRISASHLHFQPHGSNSQLTRLSLITLHHVHVHVHVNSHAHPHGHESRVTSVSLQQSCLANFSPNLPGLRTSEPTLMLYFDAVSPSTTNIIPLANPLQNGSHPQHVQDATVLRAYPGISRQPRNIIGGRC
jgi:hypothetical protein